MDEVVLSWKCWRLMQMSRSGDEAAPAVSIACKDYI